MNRFEEIARGLPPALAHPTCPNCGRRPEISMFKSDERPAERIEQLEIRIEELRDSIQRSRRLILAGRTCAVIGPTLLVCVMLGLIDFTPVRMIVGLALAIGGVVLTGSSRASTQQLEFLLKQTEKERSAAIDGLELIQAVGSVDDPGV